MGALEVAARTEWLGSKLPKDKIQLRLTHIPQTFSILKSWLSGRYFWNIIFVFFSSFCGEDYGGYSRRYQSPRWALISIRGYYLQLKYCPFSMSQTNPPFSCPLSIWRKKFPFSWDFLCCSLSWRNSRGKNVKKLTKFVGQKVSSLLYWPLVNGYRPNSWLGYTSDSFP